MEVGQTFCQVPSLVSVKSTISFCIDSKNAHVTESRYTTNYCILNLYNGFASLGIIDEGDLIEWYIDTMDPHILLLFYVVYSMIFPYTWI